MKTAAFPVSKTLEELDASACSIPGPTLDYLASLEWITAKENLCLVGPAGTGKSHVLVALGISAVTAGHKVRYFAAADLADTLYRGLADNSVGKVIENLLRNDLLLVDEVGFAPPDDTGAQPRSGSSPPPTNAARWASPATGPSTCGAGSCPSTPPPSACWTGCSITRCRDHGRRFLPHARSQSQGRNHPEQVLINPRGGDFYLATSGDRNLAIDTP